MRFLTRLLKTPDEDQNEEQDEFAAEENGLLMMPSLPGDKEEAAPAATLKVEVTQAGMLGVEGTAPSPPALEEAPPGEDQVGQPLAGEERSPDATEESPLAQSLAPETVREEAQTEQGSPDDPMHMFRASAKRANMAAALKEDLQDVPAVDLLTEARLIRNSLRSRQAAGGAGQGKHKAA